MMLLIINLLSLKFWSGRYEILEDNILVLYLIMIIFVASPVVSLILESIGFVKAVRSYRQIDVNEPYFVKRRGIKYFAIFGGAIFITALWLFAALYITYQYWVK
jgi:hypothetical protein